MGLRAREERCDTSPFRPGLRPRLHSCFAFESKAWGGDYLIGPPQSCLPELTHQVLDQTKTRLASLWDVAEY